ncbi:hypothetical protein ACTQ6A_09460 [Lachnospiraceae bacterium LCP25S3_G4]
MKIPECLSVTYYTSISGEELRPYRQLRSNVVKSFLGGYETYLKECLVQTIIIPQRHFKR